MIRFLRISILLTVLLVVVGSQWLTSQRLSRWEKPLWVTIYPVLAAPDASVRRYVQSLKPESFQSIGLFIRQQAARYGHQLAQPVIIQVAQPLTTLPPVLPAENSGIKVALWSLKMRWWAWKNGRQKELAPSDIRMFVLYQKANSGSRLERSVGIKKGGYGIVNAVASPHRAARDRIVISHELLHILGASDKYNFATGQPDAPDGLAYPEKSPLYPQQRAEIMGAHIAITARRWRRPATLRSCVIGTKTATEIGWLKASS